MKRAIPKTLLKDLAGYVEYELSEGVTTVEIPTPLLHELRKGILAPGSKPGSEVRGQRSEVRSQKSAGSTPGTGLRRAAEVRSGPPTVAPAAKMAAAETTLFSRTPASTPPAVETPVPEAAPPPAPPRGPRKPVKEVTRELDAIAVEVSHCTACKLHELRTKTVPGQGHPAPELLFIGEGPGEDEDLQGLAFVGRAGQLLTKMIEAMGFQREEVFIANIVKCRPPGNRPPMPDEMETCMPYLRRQIALLQPRIIVAMGGTATKGLLNTTLGITKIRGQWMTFEGIDVMPTFHPSYLLRYEPAKHDAWADLISVLKRLGRQPPPRKRPGGTGA